jgi:hypothetical protein
MIRSLIAAATVAAFALPAAHAATAASAPATKAPAKKTAKTTTPAPIVENAPTEPLTEAQLAVALKVMTGLAECELNQQVTVTRYVPDGYFKISWGKQTWVMHPEETTTGAVKLVDHAHSVEWLQIPAKSMLLDNAHGKRLVTECKESGQG